MVPLAVCAAVLLTWPGVSAQAQDAAQCGSGATAAAVVFAILFLLCLGVLGLVLYKYVWKRRHCPPLEKVVLGENGHQEKFAFDNPYFEGDDDIGNKSTLPSTDVLVATDKTSTARSTDSKAARKSPSWSPFAVFSPNPKIERRRALDDSFLAQPERVSVPLRGHDFTGLGFNICGNMREGIFVKDVLHRGPASESGLVRAGDRITGITVSLAHVVLEDALTILSYASPYDVQIHLEKDRLTSHTSRKAVASQPSTASERLCHPIYRSQSIDDLTKIGQTTLQSAKQSLNASLSQAPADSGAAKQDGSLTPKASSFNEKLLSKTTPPAVRTESEQLVQRDALVETIVEPSPGGYREMAVDVPDHVLEMDAKIKAASEAARLGRLGVKVLPGDGSSPATERGQSQTESTPSPVVQREMTGPACRLRTGSGSQGSGDDSPRADADGKTERSKFKMGISGFGFKKQKSKGDVEGDVDAVDVSVKMAETDERSKKGSITAINMKLPKFGGSKPVFENDKYVQKDVENVEVPQPVVVEVEKIKSAMNVSPRKPSATSSSSSSDVDAIEVDPSINADGADKKDSKSKSWGLKGLKKGLGLSKKSDSDEKDRKTSSSSSSGEETKETFQKDIPQEMRLAAGVAQERRNRRNRQHSASSTSSDEEKKVEPKPISPQPIEVEVTVADKPLSSMVPKIEVQEDVQKEVRKMESEVENVETPRAEVDKIEVLKEVLSMTPAKEIKRKEPGDERLEDAVSETVERSTVYRSTESLSADGQPRITGEVTGLVEVGARRAREDRAGSSDGRASSSSDAERDSAAPQRRAKKRRKRRSTSSVERDAADQFSSDEEKRRSARLPGSSPALPLSSTEISVDTSSTEPLNTSTPVKLAACDERDRKCASMGDLHRLGPAGPDSPPLERAVSLELRNAEPERGLGRAAEAALQGPQLDLSRVGRAAGWTEPRDGLRSASGLDGRTQIEVVPEEPERRAPPPSSTVVMLNQSAEDVTVISTEASVSGQWVTAEEGDTLLAEAAAGDRRSSVSSASSASVASSQPMEMDEGTQTSAPLDLDSSEANYVSVSSVTVGDDTLVASSFDTVVLPSSEERYTSSATFESVTYLTSTELGGQSSLVEVVSGDVTENAVEDDAAEDLDKNGHDDDKRSRNNSTSSSSSSPSSSSSSEEEEEEPARRRRTVTNEPLDASPDLSARPPPLAERSASEPPETPPDSEAHRALLRGDSKTRLLQTVLDAHEVMVASHKDRRHSGPPTSPLSVEVSSLIPPPARARPAVGAGSPPADQPPSDKELIEISEDELDSVMLSHRDYLLRQAARLSQSPRHASEEGGPEPAENGTTKGRARAAAGEQVTTIDGSVSTTLIIGEPGRSGAVTATVIGGGSESESPPPALQPPPTPQ